MSTEGTIRLKEISETVQELRHTWKTIDPSAAEDLGKQYEQRSHLWRRKIALQCAALMLVQAVSSEGDVLGDSALSTSETLESENKGDSHAEEIINSTSIQNDFEETRRILEECPNVWADITAVKKQLGESIERLVDSQVRELENKGESDWSTACDNMKLQRDQLQREIEATRTRMKALEDRDAKPTLQLLHDHMKELKDVKEEIRKTVESRQEMERLLEEHHGIIATSNEPDAPIESEEDSEEFLAAEQDAMISYYEAKINRNARIIDVTSARKPGTNLIDVTVTPKSDWLEYWRRKKPDHPGLKYVTITYSKESVYPTNIAIKVNTSTVSESAFDAVLGPLVQKTQEWKHQMMESPCVDIHGLIRLFL